MVSGLPIEEADLDATYFSQASQSKRSFLLQLAQRFIGATAVLKSDSEKKILTSEGYFTAFRLPCNSFRSWYIYFIIILLWIWTTCNRSIWRERWRFHFLDHMVLRLLMPLMVTFALFCCKYFPKGEVGKIGWGFPHRRVYMYTYGCKLPFLNFPWFEGSRSKTITELIPENS